MLRKFELLEYLSFDKFESTGRIANRLNQHWVTVYGQLSQLYAAGLVELVEIGLKKDSTMHIWKKRKNTEIPSITTKINKEKPLSDDEANKMIEKVEELRNKDDK